MENLRRIQLYILNKVVDLLDEYGYDYWLDSGTLLGARRHQGFIPWDDDIDISVKMVDYKNILNLLVEKLPNDLKVQDNALTAMDTDLTPIKIFYIPSIIEDSLNGEKNHIFIDLFVYSPINPHFIDSKCFNLLKYLLVSKSQRLTPSFSGFKKLIYIGLRITISKTLLNYIVRQIRILHLNSNYLAYDYLCWIPKAYHQKKEIFPLKKMIFEGKYYSVPNDVDSFLSKKYGENFMELPPVENRVGNHISYYEITKFPTEESQL